VTSRDEMVAKVAEALRNASVDYGEMSTEQIGELTVDALAEFLPDENGTPAGMEQFGWINKYLTYPTVFPLGIKLFDPANDWRVPVYRRKETP
jgi:hypothetical protein